MTKPVLEGKALHDVHKAVFIVNEYPGKTVREIANLFQMSPLDINNALWRAQDMGYLVLNEDKTAFTVDTVPEAWDFGDSVPYLRDQIMYTLNHMARDEFDIEETYLSNMTMGYPAHDVLIVLKQLLAERLIATYDINNTIDVGKKKKRTERTDTYTFYSLWDNSEQQWGRKQFKDSSRLS